MNFSSDGSVYANGYPPGQPTARLDALLKAAVPRSDGPSVGRWDDRTTWRATFPANVIATREELAAARAVFDAFEPWGADAPVAPVSLSFPPEDEDPGEQPEIFTEDDYEAPSTSDAPAVAADRHSDIGEAFGDDARQPDSVPDGDGLVPAEGGLRDALEAVGPEAAPGEAALQEEVAPAYPGIAFEQLSDVVSIRRAQVIDRITAIEEIRLEGLEDRLAARDEAIRNYNNWPAGVAMDPAVEAAAREWMQLDALASAIRRHASNLRRSARDASADILLSMWGSAINEGWPTDG